MDCRPQAVHDRGSDPTSESAVVTHWDPDALTIEVEAGAPGLLVLSEVYAGGWRATVDGEEVEILSTHHILRGLPVPAGSSVVELRFEPPAYRVGKIVSGFSAVAMIATFATVGLASVTPPRRRRPNGGGGTTPPRQRWPAWLARWRR